MPELLIFQAGNYPQGDWPIDRVKRMAKSYDPENNVEAPAVIGHRMYADTDEAQYAHGWVKSVRVDEKGNLFADVADISETLKTAVALKRLRYISAEIYELDKDDPKQDPYLSAIAFLGRDNPAVTATKIGTSFFSKGCSYTPAAENSTLARFTRRLSRDDIKLFDKEPKEEKSMPEPNQNTPADKTSFEAALAGKEAEIAQYKKENDDLKAASRKTEATNFYTGMRDGGKLIPAMFDRVVTFDTRMNSADQKEFREILASFGTVLDVSGQHIASKDKAKNNPAGGGDALSAKIRAYQKEKNLSSFSEAAAALYAETPALFEEGE